MAVVVGALAVGAVYELYEHHQSKEQRESKQKLKIHLISGHELPGKDGLPLSHKTSDPYVIFKQGHLGVKSSYKEKTTDPYWDEKFELGILDFKEPLKIEVYDKDILHDDPLGSAKIELNDIPTQEKEFELKLHHHAGVLHRNHGKLKLKAHLVRED